MPAATIAVESSTSTNILAAISCKPILSDGTGFHWYLLYHLHSSENFPSILVFSDDKMWNRNFMFDVLKYSLQITAFEGLSVMSHKADTSNFQHREQF